VGPWTFRRSILAAAAFFAALIFGIFARHSDPRLLFFEDLGYYYLPAAALSYASPELSASRMPAPESFLGSTSYAAALQSPLHRRFQPLRAAVSRVAPEAPAALSVFEWRLTALYMLAGSLCLFALFTGRGMDPFLAAALAAVFPFSGPVFQEWQHLTELRGALLLPLPLLLVDRALRRGRAADWAAACAGLLVMALQSAGCLWIVPFTAAWLALHLLLEAAPGRRLRTAALGGAAVAAAALALGPTYLRFGGTFSRAAFHAVLQEPAAFLAYLRALRENCALDRVLTPFPWEGGGLAPLFLAALFLPAGAAVAEKAGEGPRPGAAEAGLLLLSAGLLLSLVPYLPDRALLALAFPGGGGASHLASFLAQAFHASWRTWFLMSYAGGILLVAASAPAWLREPFTPARRAGHAAVCWAAYVWALGFASYLFRGRVDAAALLRDGALLAGALAALLAAAQERMAWRASGRIALLLAAALSAARLGGSYLGKADDSPFGARLLAAETEVLRNLPESAKGNYRYRVVMDPHLPNLCHYARCASLESYPVRMVPEQVLRFFDEVGVLGEVSLPYYAHFDLEKLGRSGIAPMLGLRHWVLASPPPSFLAGRPSRPLTADGRVRYYEDTRAFPRAWPLERWSSAPSLELCAASVADLGRQGALGREGAVWGGLAAAPPSRGRGAGPKPLVRVLSVEPGRLECRTESAAPFLLATNKVHGPEWQVFVDGRPAEPVKADCIFLGVPLAPGMHVVEFLHDARRRDGFLKGIYKES
jgi:hypothetical protein